MRHAFVLIFLVILESHLRLKFVSAELSFFVCLGHRLHNLMQLVSVGIWGQIMRNCLVSVSCNSSLDGVGLSLLDQLGKVVLRVESEDISVAGPSSQQLSTVLSSVYLICCDIMISCLFISLDFQLFFCENGFILHICTMFFLNSIVSVHSWRLILISRMFRILFMTLRNMVSVNSVLPVASVVNPNIVFGTRRQSWTSDRASKDTGLLSIFCDWAFTLIWIVRIISARHSWVDSCLLFSHWGNYVGNICMYGFALSDRRNQIFCVGCSIKNWTFCAHGNRVL